MASQPHDATDLTALGREWIAAWNSHDLERVLALYAEDSEMTSGGFPRWVSMRRARCAARTGCALIGGRLCSGCPICGLS